MRDDFIELLIGEIAVDDDDVRELLRNTDILRPDQEELEGRCGRVVVRLKCRPPLQWVISPRRRVLCIRYVYQSDERENSGGLHHAPFIDAISSWKI